MRVTEKTNHIYTKGNRLRTTSAVQSPRRLAAPKLPIKRRQSVRLSEEPQHCPNDLPKRSLQTMQHWYAPHCWQGDEPDPESLTKLRERFAFRAPLRLRMNCGLGGC